MVRKIMYFTKHSPTSPPTAPHCWWECYSVNCDYPWILSLQVVVFTCKVLLGWAVLQSSFLLEVLPLFNALILIKGP